MICIKNIIIENTAKILIMVNNNVKRKKRDNETK